MKLVKLLLFPFAVLYGTAVSIYHFFYDAGILGSYSSRIPTISLGNISMGGSGKTPHVEYLLRLLGKNFKVATLSRGYGRTSSGFKFVESEENAATCGDEPYMMKRKFPTKTVAVSENRVKGVKQLEDAPEPFQAILLDDAYQHRRITPGMNILLTDYSNLYMEDFLFPTGSLRETKAGARRADIIVVTKTPKIFSPLERRVFKSKLKPKPYQKVFFSYMRYGNLIPVFGNSISKMLDKDKYLDASTSVVLVTGIASSRNLYYFLKDRVKEVKHLKYRDHYRFKPLDCKKIKDSYNAISNTKKLILTTEKDSMRMLLPAISDILNDLPIYYIPIKVEFHDNDREEFNHIIKDYVKRNQNKR